MYAIFRTGGKQYRVSEGQIVRLEKLDIATGEQVQFSQVMLIANSSAIKIGQPFINGSIIMGQVIAHGRKDKITIIKFHRRKHFRKHQGHRQWFTDVKITNINR